MSNRLIGATWSDQRPVYIYIRERGWLCFLLLLSRTFSTQYLLGIFWGWLMDPCCGLSLWAAQTAHPNRKLNWNWTELNHHGWTRDVTPWTCNPMPWPWPWLWVRNLLMSLMVCVWFSSMVISKLYIQKTIKTVYNGLHTQRWNPVSVMLDFGLGLKANIFGLKANIFGLAGPWTWPCYAMAFYLVTLLTLLSWTHCSFSTDLMFHKIRAKCVPIWAPAHRPVEV